MSTPVTPPTSLLPLRLRLTPLTLPWRRLVTLLLPLPVLLQLVLLPQTEPTSSPLQQWTSPASPLLLTMSASLPLTTSLLPLVTPLPLLLTTSLQVLQLQTSMTPPQI